MRRYAVNFIVDAVSLLVMLGIIATGLVMRFVLPPGSGGRGDGPGKSLWDWGRHDWGDLHFWLAAGLAALLVVHVVLHWAWVCVTARALVRPGAPPSTVSRAWRRNLFGAGLLSAVFLSVVAFLWVARANVSTVQGGRYFTDQAATQATDSAEDLEGGPERHGAAGEQIRGSMTLGEVALLAGVSVQEICTDLRLPATVSPQEQLGRLRRQYGFEMSIVRRIVQEHRGNRTSGP